MTLLSKKVTPHILAVNCGSSSIKLSLFTVEAIGMKSCTKIYDATLKGIGSPQITLHIQKQGQEESIKLTEASLKAMIDVLQTKHAFDPSSLVAVGHRFVHGGERYIDIELLTPDIIADLGKLSSLAPLHNPICLKGIEDAMALFGDLPHFVIFDTAFSSTMPFHAQYYAIPYHLSNQYGIKRYGFHGIAHQNLYAIYRQHSVQVANSAKVITIHLGGGCSMAAIKDGVCMDTSMGFTPAEGLVMATRAGDVDAAIIPFLCAQEKKSAEEVMDLLNHQSGLLGVSGSSASMEKLLEQYDDNHIQTRLAVDLFCYRITKYLGGYLAILGGVEAIIFSGGIGENSPFIRERVLSGLAWYGAKISATSNQRAVKLVPGDLHKISTADSSIDAYVIAADENAFIVQQILDQERTGKESLPDL